MLEHLHGEATKLAQKIWVECKELEKEASHPYLDNKKVASHKLKIDDNNRLVIPLYDKDGIITSLQYIYPNGKKQFLKGGRKKGSFWTIGQLDNIHKAFLAEGYATAASIYETTGIPVIIAFDAGNIKPTVHAIRAKYPHLELTIVADNDESGIGEKKANEATEISNVKVIVIPKSGMDANDYINAGYDLKSFLGSVNEIIPLDIFGRIHPERFNLQLLPKTLCDFVTDEADRMGSDPGMLALFALGAVTAVLDDRLNIQVKEYDDTWTESPRLWIAVVAPPSTKKSPTLNAALRPIRKIEAERHKKFQNAYEDVKGSTSNLEKEGINPSKPIKERITVSDATIEKIADILGHQEPRGITAIHDELSGWLAGMDAYKGNGIHKDRAAWLTAYTGGHLSVDRIGRGSTFIENWSISVIGGIQPEVLYNYLKASAHDGMLPRFLIYNGESCPLGKDRIPDYKALEAYDNLIAQLYDIQPDQTITMTHESHEIRNDFFKELKVHIELCENQFVKAALEKMEGTWARLVLILHSIIATEQGKHPQDIQVSKETTLNAVGIARILIRQALYFYSAVDPEGDNARVVANLILAKGWSRFTVKRDLGQNWKTFNKMKPWEYERIIDRLEAYGWIETEGDKRNERGRPIAYRVNPLVHTMFREQAEGERIRRKSQVEFMREKGLTA